MMQISVLVEPMPNNGFRASGTTLFAVSAEGATRAEALANLKGQVQARLGDGGEIVTLEVAPQPHPLAKYAGMFPDDELTQEWVKSMAEYRRRAGRVMSLYAPFGVPGGVPHPPRLVRAGHTRSAPSRVGDFTIYQVCKRVGDLD